MRVVSLLPSATEMVWAIAGASILDGRGPVHLVGRSHECDVPGGGSLDGVPALTSPRTGSAAPAEVDGQVRACASAGEPLQDLDVELLAELRPDVILTQGVCAVCAIDVERVRGAAAEMDRRGLCSPRVVSFNPQTVDGIFDDLLTVGRALGMEGEALRLVVGLRERMDRAEGYVNPFTARVRVAFVEWTDPLYVGGHWTPQLIERAGGEHPLNPTHALADAGAGVGPAGQAQRKAGKSIRVESADLAATLPEVVVVCPCGLGLDDAWAEMGHLASRPWFAGLPAASSGRVAVVDGHQMFNRPGPRVVDAFEFLVGLINERPELIPAAFPWRAWAR